MKGHRRFMRKISKGLYETKTHKKFFFFLNNVYFDQTIQSTRVQDDFSNFQGGTRQFSNVNRFAFFT